MKTSLLLLGVLLAFSPKIKAQQDSLPELKKYIIDTDTTQNRLVTPMGFDVFFARKSIKYLTGTSDLSLSRFYTTYSGDNNRLNLGVNFPVKTKIKSNEKSDTANKNKGRIFLILNPIFESDLKSGFSTIFTDDKNKNWEPSNNLRGGLKLTYFPHFGRIKFYKDSIRLEDGTKIRTKKGRKEDLQIVRAQKYDEIVEAHKKLKDKIKTKIPKLTNGKLNNDSLTFSDTAKVILSASLTKYEKSMFETLGSAEADYIETYSAYTRAFTFWFSAWGFTPFSKSEMYTSPTATESFTKTSYWLRELSLQGTFLYDLTNFGTLTFNPWVTFLENNSANAGMMDNAEYVKYNPLPGISPSDMAILEKGIAYYGDYEKFNTTNLNLQLVYFFPVKDWHIQPGLSFRYEKFWGKYSLSNFRVGIPVTLSGKGSQTYNIELQCRWNDMKNFKEDADHKTKRTIGLSVGLPLAKLY